MLKNIKKHKKLFALVLLFLFCVSLFTVILPKEVRGVGPFPSPGAGKLIELGLDLLGLEPSDIVIAAAKFINYLIGLIAGFLFWLGAQIIVFFLSLNAKVVQLPAVEIGWSIARDIANLGFVLAIIIIAMATITRFESYGAKKLLPKLIAAAILVNFSLTIGSVFVDFSNVLSNFFIRKSVGGEVNISEFANSFAAAFNIQSFMQTKGGGNTGSVSISGELYNSLGAILSIFIAAVFTFIAALTLLGIALMLLVRLIYLAVLLIISPIAWLFWVIPSLEGEFKKWWTNFLHWIFYAPILTFFLYLALASIMKIREFTGSYSTTAALSGSGVKENMTLTKDVFSAIANMVVLVGLLVAGLITARSMGMVGAKGMIGIAEKAGQGARKWAGKKTGETAKGVGRRIATAGTDEEGKTGLERWAAKSKLAKIPLLGRGVTAISGMSSKAKAGGRKLYEEEEKRASTRTGEDSAIMLNRSKVMSDERKAALGKRALDTGNWDKIDKTEQENVIRAMQKMGTGDTLLATHPELATRFNKKKDGETDEQFKRRVVEKAMMKNVDNAVKLKEDVLVEREVSINLKPAHITQLGNQGTESQKRAVVGALAEAIGESTLKDLNDLKLKLMEQEKLLADAQARGDKKAIEDTIEKRDEMKESIEQTKESFTKEQKKALGVYESIQQNTNWHDVVPPLKVKSKPKQKKTGGLKPEDFVM